MNYSFTDATANGVATTFSFSFVGDGKGYLRDSDVHVFVNGVEVSYTLTGENQVTLSPAPANGALVRIRRIMPKDTIYAQFNRGITFNKTHLNNSFLQSLYVVHEFLDGFLDEFPYVLKGDMEVLGSITCDGLITSADIDMLNNQIKNLAYATDAGDAVPLAQALEIASQAQGANFVSETKPLLAFSGMRWYKPSDASTYVWYVDADGGQWVEEAVQSAEGTLRSELAGTTSTVQVGGVEARSLRSIDGVKNLLPNPNVAMSTSGFYTGSTYGRGVYIYDPALAGSNHNGGTVISASALAVFDGTPATISAFLNHTGTGTGCWIESSAELLDIDKFGAVPYDNGADSAPALAAAYKVAKVTKQRIVGNGSYWVSSGLVLDAINDVDIFINELAPTNDFATFGNLFELGKPSDVTRFYGCKITLNYVSGRSPNGVIKANVFRNYSATFANLNAKRVFGVIDLYKADQPNVPIGDNIIHGELLENCDHGMYLHGTEGSENHVEHNILKYNFVAGAAFGAVYARGRAHYQEMIGAYDFNGQALIKVTTNVAPANGVNIGDALGNDTRGENAIVYAITTNTDGSKNLLCKKTGGAYNWSAGDVCNINGGTQFLLTAFTNYKSGGPYLDFISQTEANFARHTINCSFLTDVFGNNEEDWIVFSATSASNQRAALAGTKFIASSSEQYMQATIDTWQVRSTSNVNAFSFTPSFTRMQSLSGGVELGVASSGKLFYQGPTPADVVSAAGFSIPVQINGVTYAIEVKQFT